MKIQLTELQKNQLNPLLQKKHEADIELTKALGFIVGKEFTKYSIKNGELEVELKEEDKPLEELK